VGETHDEAFEAFARGYATTLLRLAGALTGDPHVSEDVVQVALERVSNCGQPVP
jgi:DNA-directed RNA polymerase specialized sigma24 family protein